MYKILAGHEDRGDAVLFSACSATRRVPRALRLSDERPHIASVSFLPHSLISPYMHISLPFITTPQVLTRQWNLLGNHRRSKVKGNCCYTQMMDCFSESPELRPAVQANPNGRLTHLATSQTC